MKDNFQPIKLANLCGWFGVGRQAYYKQNWAVETIAKQEDMVLQEVAIIRKKHCKIGTRKLYTMLQPFIKEHAIKMGRDALFTTLSSNNLLVRKRKRRIQTTQSYHRFHKYPNLIRDFIPTAINQLWVSDITYWKLEEKYVYISFITDAYSRKIVGYHVADTLAAVECLQALKMAFSALRAESHFQLIHHSDRGVKYCCNQYVKLLQQHHVTISMTENGDPLENAIAERLNGIIKDEYLENYEVVTIKEAKAVLKKAVDLYNKERPHMSLGNLTPNQIHVSKNTPKPEKLWKNYYQKNPTIVT